MFPRGVARVVALLACGVSNGIGKLGFVWVCEVLTFDCSDVNVEVSS